MGRSTGGSTPVSQKNGMPTGDRAIVIAAADCAMLSAQELFVQINFTVSYSGLKVVIYSLCLWLPYYITQVYDTSNITGIRYSAFFDLGSIIGGVILGLVVDQMQFKSLLLSFGIFISAILCTFFCLFADTEVEVAILLTLIGVFLGGCNNLLFGPIRIELGLKMKVSSGHHLEVNETLSTLSGLMEGTATVAAAFAQIPTANQILLNLSSSPKCQQCTQLYPFVSHQPPLSSSRTSGLDLLSSTASRPRLPTYSFCLL
ncbi:sugar phosphate exchanger 3-like [Convolutriloba macropyga]|uniref:sugar phosphate exchanger 3-like n=1 Tax=Convolutriloba macropyga TaxID=536237 RepID=UPI003F51D16A